MHFDDEGRLRAINPENGFFGVAPGTSISTNPIALGKEKDTKISFFFKEETKIFARLDMIHENTIFTNVAETSDGDVYWEGIDEDIDGLQDKMIRSWKNKRWSSDLGEPAAHPNSR